MTKSYLSAVAIAKDEHPYIREWLHFHRIAGFERFFIYENSTDLLTAKEIQSDAELAPLCEIIHWPGKYSQLQCYEHFIAYLADQTHWAAFFDCDEFLFRTDHGDLKDALTAYEQVPGLGVNWLMFGSSGHLRKPDGLVTQNYLMRADTSRPLCAPKRARTAKPESASDYWPYYSEIKSIVQTARVAGVLTPHSFTYKDGEAVDENFEPIPDPRLKARTARVSTEKFRVHHYWSKSIEEFSQKLARGRSDIVTKYEINDAFLREYTMNEVRDETALPIAARIPLLGSPKPRPPRNTPLVLPQTTVSAVHRRGRYFHFVCQNPQDEVQKHHKEGLFYELEELELIERNLKRRDITVFDVGANVGNHAVYFAKVMNVKEVVVFEPNPPAITLLRANLLLNSCDNVETAYLGYGLGDTPAEMTIYEPYANNLSAARMKAGAQEGAVENIPVLPGDRFAIGYKSLAFLKIDVEGMELAALRGFAWTIRRYRPDIFIEVVDGNLPEFNKWCEKNRYQVVESYRRYKHLENYYVRAH